MATDSALRANEESSSSDKTDKGDSNGSNEDKNLDTESESTNLSASESLKTGGDLYGFCYCGKDRNLNQIELLCANCGRWFHESCISYQLGKIVAFLTNYVFMCKHCSPTGLESFKKCQAQISQMCITAIANLQQATARDGAEKTMFCKDKEIIPYIEHYWEALTTSSRRVTQSWYSTVHRALMKDVHTLFLYEVHGEVHNYGLINSDLTLIKPNYDAMIKGGILRVTDMGVQHAAPVAGGIKSRNAKRKLPGETSSVNKKGRSGGADFGIIKLLSHGYPLDHPFNKDGYRYLLAEPDPHAPFRQEFDESADWAGKPIPGWLYRTLVPSAVLLALQDRAPQLRISDDRLSVTGEKGYCTVRATHAVSSGCWYWEATIDEMPEGSATRIGWGQEYANLQAPLGYDKFGYSWRSLKGTRFHESMGKHYSEGGYTEGDTVGFMIVMPEHPQLTVRMPNTYKDRPLVKFKSHLYYEEKDNVPEYLKKMKVLEGSKIYYFKNGECQGMAFQDLYTGRYYPTISLHKCATVSANFGPSFKCPPSTEIPYKPVSDKSEESVAEHTMADLIYLTENEGKLRLDNFVL